MNGAATETQSPMLPSTAKHVNYTLGMVLGVDDFVQEFTYHDGRRQAFARELIGYGTVVGLQVSVQSDARGPRVMVAPGVALSPRGQTIRVCAAQCAYLQDWLNDHRNTILQRLGSPPDDAITAHLALCYRDCTSDPVPIPGEPCRRAEDMSSSSSNYSAASAYVQSGQNIKYMIREGAASYYGGYYYGGGGGGATTPPPAAAPPPASAPAVTATTVSDLQVLISAIPIAQDGDVITADYHNSVRSAFIAMANRLGLGIITEEIFITNAPNLFKVDGQGEWKNELGQVKKAAADTGALRGWMELDLPDGARIKKMNVYASNDTAGTMKVKLRRQSVSSSAGDDLIAIDVANNDASTVKDGDVTLPGSTLGNSAIEEARSVDNQKYKYLFVAELDGGVSGKEAKILSMQVVLGK